jgi:hypothetical protein
LLTTIQENMAMTQKTQGRAAKAAAKPAISPSVEAITRADLQRFCNDDNSIIDCLFSAWQVAGNKLWSVGAHRIAPDVIVVRTRLDDELREWGVLDEAGWAAVKSRAGSYDDGHRMLRVAAGMREHSRYGEHAAAHAD